MIHGLYLILRSFRTNIPEMWNMFWHVMEYLARHAEPTMFTDMPVELLILTIWSTAWLVMHMGCDPKNPRVVHAVSRLCDALRSDVLSFDCCQ